MRIYQPLSALAFLIVATAAATGCASGLRKSASAASNVLAAKCESTPVKISDLEKFGFNPAPGKVVVVRLFRVNCPYCKEDLLRIGSYFQNNTWSKDHVQLFLIAYRKEGVEDRKTFDMFMREELGNLGIPLEAAQVVYVDRDYHTLIKSKNAGGYLLFEGWKAVPFGMVFGKNGRLAYRGHFTTTLGSEDEHYRFITTLQSEVCPVTAHVQAAQPLQRCVSNEDMGGLSCIQSAEWETISVAPRALASSSRSRRP